METRKVQLSGGTTYTVSLPKQWAQEHDISAGSVLSLHPNGDGSLLVEASANRSGTDHETRVDIATDSEAALQQRIRALHAVGFDTVTLVDKTGHTDGRRAVVEDAVAELSGFELLSATDTRMQLTNLIDAENVDVRKSALRLRLLMLAMHRDAVDAVLSDDSALADRVVGRDSEADKLFALVTRHFRRALTNLQEVEKLDYSRDELFEYYYACRQFERVADHAVKIARFANDPDATVPEVLADRLDAIAADSRKVVDTAADVVLSDAGIEAAHSALERHHSLQGDISQLDRDLYAHDDPAEAYVAGLLLDSVRRTAEYGVNIAGIAVQQTVRQGLDE
jgi:phosphate uptake regulator